MTTVVLLSRASVLPAKDDAVVSLTPDPLLFLHHFLGLYFIWQTWFVQAASILEENTSTGDKVEVKLGQKGAQSFAHGSAGSADFQVTKVVIYLSQDAEAPDGNLTFNIGTDINTGAISGSTVTITPSDVTDTSAGATFMTFEVTFASPVGPLTAGTTYYLNFENEAPNGKAFYLQYTGSDTYPGGTYFKSGSDDGKDIRFQVWGDVTVSVLSSALVGESVLQALGFGRSDSALLGEAAAQALGLGRSATA